jgi:hypothetical protein
VKNNCDGFGDDMDMGRQERQCIWQAHLLL